MAASITVVITFDPIYGDQPTAQVSTAQPGYWALICNSNFSFSRLSKESGFKTEASKNLNRWQHLDVTKNNGRFLNPPPKCILLNPLMSFFPGSVWYSENPLRWLVIYIPFYSLFPLCFVSQIDSLWSCVAHNYLSYIPHTHTHTLTVGKHAQSMVIIVSDHTRWYLDTHTQLLWSLSIRPGACTPEARVFCVSVISWNFVFLLESHQTFHPIPVYLVTEKSVSDKNLEESIRFEGFHCRLWVWYTP